MAAAVAQRDRDRRHPTCSRAARAPTPLARAGPATPLRGTLARASRDLPSRHLGAAEAAGGHRDERTLCRHAVPPRPPRRPGRAEGPAGPAASRLGGEIYVINHETVAAACILTVIIYAVKKYGADVAAFADKLNEEKIAKALEVKNEAIKALETAIEEEKKEQWRIEGRSYLFDAKRNNIAMLLEANYRERLLTVYNEVKKRLDYQVALQNLKRQKEQDHMVQWVEKSVIQSITPQQQKESIAKCILDLKALSKSAQVAV
ncbi:ATP synthase F(0) complex subunit B1, mitochondrial [Gallus gallus]|uniref:ATP synthase F(0) complex subunit B1, mitochondrial n=1 Tax=Gallus gallus TaxID=9031 RepID=UPI001AE20EC2|nr:ATP synthase F(0) complex subunit B1, mitochondrial [Gallus gallus]XP_046789096.1 ATP synthase F(0) complex subunit B1, mitochondrial [Gallus gallus]